MNTTSSDQREHARGTSSRILAEVSESTLKTLTATRASSWVADLNQVVHVVEERIQQCIHTNSSSFTRQWESSKSVKERYSTLASNVDRLSSDLSDPKIGLVPAVIKTLSQHSQLAQNAANTSCVHRALTHLGRCTSELRVFSEMAGSGKLVDAVEQGEWCRGVLDSSPVFLLRTKPMESLEREYRVIRDSIEEQLNEAYTRSVQVTDSGISISPSVKVRQSDAFITLPNIMSSLSRSSLSSRLSTLRRDVVEHLIEPLLQRPITVETSSTQLEDQTTAVVFSFSPNSAPQPSTSTLANLHSLLDFLQDRLFQCIPLTELQALTTSLVRPITNSILQFVVIPNLPSKLQDLDMYIHLVKDAVVSEDDVVRKLGGSDTEKVVGPWVANIEKHYGRKRRIELLDKARILISQDPGSSTFRVELPPEPQSPVVGVVQREVAPVPTNGSEEEDAWGFEEEPAAAPVPIEETPNPIPSEEEDAWGFGDSPGADEEGEVQEAAGRDEGDAWGWDDDGSSPQTLVSTGLNGTGKDSPHSDFVKQSKLGMKHVEVTVPQIAEPVPPQKNTDPVLSEVVTPDSYLVSSCASALLELLRSITAECHELATSLIFDTPSSTSDKSVASSSLVYQSVSMTVDLYRALRPISLGKVLDSTMEKQMVLANDCHYLAGQVKILSVDDDTAHSMLDVSVENLHAAGQWSFDSTVDKQCEAVRKHLSDANGFSGTVDQDVFDECELVMSKVLRLTLNLGRQWKLCLNKAKYHIAIGQVTEAALSKILTDILALPDIPELESKRLSELCRMLGGLESLFIEGNTDRSCVVAYVPSWLKYSYLSELLEGSIADISYLFEEGALVDFNTEELCNLVRALFADTPLRRETIGKFMAGHPVAH